MTDRKPTIPAVPPASWLRPHAAHLRARLQERGQGEETSINTLAVAFIEEAAMFTTAYSRNLADPARRLVDGDGPVLLALAGTTISAYALSDALKANLDDWCAIKLQHLNDDDTSGRGVDKAVDP